MQKGGNRRAHQERPHGFQRGVHVGARVLVVLQHGGDVVQHRLVAPAAPLRAQSRAQRGAEDVSVVAHLGWLREAGCRGSWACVGCHHYECGMLRDEARS